MNSKKKNRKRVMISMVVLLSVLIIAFIIIYTSEDKHNSEKVNEEQNNIEETQNVPLETQDTLLETQFMSMYIPEDLEETLIIDINESEGFSSIVYSAMIGETKLELFSILFSASEIDGYMLGTLQEDDNSINVLIRMNEQLSEEWNEEEFIKINSLQERVNDFIVQIQEDSRFSTDK